MKLDQKKEFVTQLKEKLSRAKVVIATDYKGLNVAAMNDLRTKLRELDIEYRIIKNTMLRRAVKDTEIDMISDAFVGPNGIAISYDDPVAPAKVLTQFAKDNKKFEIKSGVLGGKIMNEGQIKALASLPPRDVLLGQLLSTMNAVPTGLVTVLSGIPRQFLNVLQALKEKKEAA